MDKDIEKLFKNLQISVHDQIGALKADVQKSSADTQAALDICSELEKSVNLDISDKKRIQRLSDIVNQIVEISIEEAKENDLNFKRLRIISAINYAYSRLSVLNLIIYRICSEKTQELYKCIQPLYHLNEARDGFIEKIYLAKNTQELQGVIEEFAGKFKTIQDEINELNIKLIDG
ncbi:MAG: hypothetical protein ABR958_08860 [Dehalococcoidales bacterium]